MAPKTPTKPRGSAPSTYAKGKKPTKEAPPITNATITPSLSNASVSTLPSLAYSSRPPIVP